MGSWDISPFGNDEARQWLADLMVNNSTEPVFRALVTAAKMREDEFLQAPECERAVAAAELVACARGKCFHDVPKEVTDWLAVRKFVAGDQIAQMALKLLERIASSSELKQVWDDTDSAQDWYEYIRDLQNRLRESHEGESVERMPVSALTSDQLCEQAAVLVSERKYDAALLKYQEALNINSSSQSVYMGRAICNLWLGNSEKVIEDINKAINLGKRIPDAYQLRSQAFFHLKKYRNVVADLSTFLDVRPNHMESYYIRGLAYTHLQHYEKAMTDFTIIIERNIMDHMADALTQRAFCYDQLGRPDLAAWDRQHAAQLAAASAYPTA